MTKKIAFWFLGLLLLVTPIVSPAQGADIQTQVQALQAQIAALLLQIQTLEAKLGLSSSTPTPLPTPSASQTGSSCVTILRHLSYGAHGNDVSDLQRFLAQDASIYPEKIVSGFFGSLTQAAVQRFQARYAIVSSGTPESGYGVVGPLTRGQIRSLSCANTQGISPFVGPTAPACQIAGLSIPSGGSASLYVQSSVPFNLTCEVQSRLCINGVLTGDSRYQYGTCTIRSASACSIAGLTVPHGTSRVFYSQSSAPFNTSCSSHSQTRTCDNGVLLGSSQYVYPSCSTDSPSVCTLDNVEVSHNASRTFYSASSVASTASCLTVSQLRTCVNGVLSGSDSYNKSSCSVGISCVIDGESVSHGQSRLLYFAKNIPRNELCTSYSQSRLCSDGVFSGNSSYIYTSCAPVAAQNCALDNAVVAHSSSTPFYSTTQAPAGKSCSSYVLSRTCTSGVLSGSSSYNRARCSDTAPCILDGITVQHGSSTIFYNKTNVAFGIGCASVSKSRVCTNAALSGSIEYKYGRCSVTAPGT